MKKQQTKDNSIAIAFSIFPTQKYAAKKLSELSGRKIGQQSISNWIVQGYVPANKVALVYAATKRKVSMALLNPKSHGDGR
jgi:hypothetical protein